MHKQDDQDIPKLQADDRLVEIELLFQTALKDLKDKKDTDVDFEYLFSLVDIYNKFYEPVTSNDKRWLGYTEEILVLLSESGEEAAMEMKKMIDMDRPVNAYQKAMNRSSEMEEE